VPDPENPLGGTVEVVTPLLLAFRGGLRLLSRFTSADVRRPVLEAYWNIFPPYPVLFPGIDLLKLTLSDWSMIPILPAVLNCLRLAPLVIPIPNEPPRDLPSPSG